MANNNNKNRGFTFNIYWMYLLVLVALFAAYFFNDDAMKKEVNMTEFESAVRSGGVKKIVVYTGQSEAEGLLTDSLANVMFKPRTSTSKHMPASKIVTKFGSLDKFDEKVESWRQEGSFKGDVSYDNSGGMDTFFWYFGPFILLIFFYWLMTRRMGGGSGGGIFSVGKSKAKIFDKKSTKPEDVVTFENVAGLEREKKEVAEVVDFLKNPERYTELGGTIPKGILLVGPPGTGKTLLAKAVAGEAQVPFFSMSGSDFVEMFVGVGASRVRDLFNQAKSKAPCIVFIDEIDAIGRARSRKHDFQANDERENTLNQLLTEMDGFGNNSGVIVLAATNRADVLDKALLRAGRFDRQIYIGIPRLEDRIAIFKVHLKDVKMDGSVDLEMLARMTSGLSGADIANICNEAVLLAARKKKRAVQQDEFVEAIARVRRTLDKPEQATQAVTFDDVAAMHNSKSAVREVINYLHAPEHYRRLGGRIPRGVLLVGPSGSGKTLLAKAVAGECNVPFFSRSASEFQGGLVGSGVDRIKELFRDAREKAPCIIFIDELDSMGNRKGNGNSVNEERVNTLNQLLAEMDGYTTDDAVIVLAATDRVDDVDKSLIRAGRFDRKIYVGFPGLNDRLEIFGLYTNRIVTGEDLDLEQLAKLSSGFSGADIAKTCNDAALDAAGKDHPYVSQNDLVESIKTTRKGLDIKSIEGEPIKFADVAGMEEAKQEITEIIDFLKDPMRFKDLGGKPPRGALLVGPPGTGKTMLARAVAGEAHVPFFSRSGSEFDEVWVGLGASRIRELFQEAKEKAPCVVFIDEIDALGGARNAYSSSGREQTLNQLLTEMDGMDGNTGVIVLAATNRAEMLDEALLRPGRFDRKVYIGLPSMSDREAIFKVHLKKIKLDPSVDIVDLAKQTAGFSGADIANICNEAAILAARYGHRTVMQQDFNEAYDKVTMGLENKSMLLTQQDKYETAVHEAGHATASWHLQYTDPLVKISIVPRGQALGVNLHQSQELVHKTKQAYLDEICTFMAGRAAEEVYLGTIGTGALNDMQQATRIARAMVMYYGMSDRMPNISYYDPRHEMGEKPYSDSRAQMIDEEIQNIINEQYQRAKELVAKYGDGLRKIVDELMDREVIFTEDVEKIFGKRPWKYRSEEIAEIYEERRRKREAERRKVAVDADVEPATSSDEEKAASPAGDEATPPPFNPQA